MENGDNIGSDAGGDAERSAKIRKKCEITKETSETADCGESEKSETRETASENRAEFAEDISLDCGGGATCWLNNDSDGDFSDRSTFYVAECVGDYGANIVVIYKCLDIVIA